MEVRDTRRSGYPVNFRDVPFIGQEIVYWGGVRAALVAVEPYTRADGVGSHVLTWAVGERLGTSGLRSKAFVWVPA